MRLIIDKYPSILLHHLSDVLSVKYNIPFFMLLNIWIDTGKPNMIKFGQLFKLGKTA